MLRKSSVSMRSAIRLTCSETLTYCRIRRDFFFIASICTLCQNNVLIDVCNNFFQSNMNIKDLELSGNDLSGKGATYLAEGLKENVSINDLVSRNSKLR